MRLPVFQDFSEGYVATLTELLRSGEAVAGVVDATSVGSAFGAERRSTLELRPYGFRVTDPSICFLADHTRQPNLVYAVAQWLWVMSGSDDVEAIAFYNDRARAFSDDGVRLPSAFGARMRRPVDQLQAALDLLRADPTSRRALIAISRSDDLAQARRDHACAQSLQLFVRDGKLEAITIMRSQSALMVFPYDAAMFMTLQFWAAAVLGIGCGPHSWIANSMHIYEDEVPLAERPGRRAEAVEIARHLRSGAVVARAATAGGGSSVSDAPHGFGCDRRRGPLAARRDASSVRECPSSERRASPRRRTGRFRLHARASSLVAGSC